MRILKPGDPCPLCGKPIPDGLPTRTMIYLSWLAEGKQLMEATKEMEESK